jgi:hypothetical protein
MLRPVKEETMNEERRKKQNRDMVPKVDKTIRPAVAAVLPDLENQGQRRVIDVGVWRSPAEQLEKFKHGFSKVKYGYHCATTKDGKPDSLAADIVDANKFWNASREFWLRLGASALAHNLGRGGFFGLPKNMKDTLRAELKHKNFNSPAKLGWDAAHVETTRVTIAEAKAGKR